MIRGAAIKRFLSTSLLLLAATSPAYSMLIISDPIPGSKASQSSRSGVPESVNWLFGPVEMININAGDSSTTPSGDGKNYYLLALPVTLPGRGLSSRHVTLDILLSTDPTHASLDLPGETSAQSDEQPAKKSSTQPKTPPSSPDTKPDDAKAKAASFELEAIFPTHVFVPELFTHTNELDATISPQVYGFSALSLTGRFTSTKQMLADMPVVTGTFSRAQERLSWDFKKQWKDPIPTGSITFYALVSSDGDFNVPIYYRGLLSDHESHASFTNTPMAVVGSKDNGFTNLNISPSKRTLSQYIRLHKSELPAESAAFLNGLLSKTNAADSAKKTYEVSVQAKPDPQTALGLAPLVPPAIKTTTPAPVSPATTTQPAPTTKPHH